jgi:hypothetical protein
VGAPEKFSLLLFDIIGLSHDTSDSGRKDS